MHRIVWFSWCVNVLISLLSHGYWHFAVYFIMAVVMWDWINWWRPLRSRADCPLTLVMIFFDVHMQLLKVPYLPIPADNNLLVLTLTGIDRSPDSRSMSFGVDGLLNVCTKSLICTTGFLFLFFSRLGFPLTYRSITDCRTHTTRRHENQSHRKHLLFYHPLLWPLWTFACLDTDWFTPHLQHGRNFLFLTFHGAWRNTRSQSYRRKHKTYLCRVWHRAFA